MNTTVASYKNVKVQRRASTVCALTKTGTTTTNVLFAVKAILLVGIKVTRCAACPWAVLGWQTVNVTIKELVTSSRHSVIAMQRIKAIIANNAKTEAWQRLAASAVFRICALTLQIVRCALTTESARLWMNIASASAALDISHLFAILVQINLLTLMVNVSAHFVLISRKCIQLSVTGTVSVTARNRFARAQRAYLMGSTVRTAWLGTWLDMMVCAFLKLAWRMVMNAVIMECVWRWVTMCNVSVTLVMLVHNALSAMRTTPWLVVYAFPATVPTSWTVHGIFALKVANALLTRWGPLTSATATMETREKSVLTALMASPGYCISALTMFA